MLLFGHVGITVGAAYVIAPVANRIKVAPLGKTAQTLGGHRGPVFRGRVLDWRLLAFGSMLPDIVDKPIGILFFGSEGRLLLHTLAFVIALGLVGLFLATRGKPWIFVLAVCCAGHLILDIMWREPKTLFWPLHGWRIAKYDPFDWRAFDLWSRSMERGLETNNLTMAAEIVGVLVMVALMTWWIVDWRRERARRGNQGFS